MSDKLSDERREHLEFIERCDPTFLIMHLGNRTAFDADALESVFQLAKERARELLAASPAPAIPADDSVLVPRALLADLTDDVEEYASRHSFREREARARADTIASARTLLRAPAISESEDASPNPWVPKSASLPSEPGWYLVMLDPDNDWGLMSHTPLQVEFDAFTSKPREFTCICDWRTDEVITPAVTHWMPMPAGPGDAARKGGKS